jgi:hypothetical protein
MVSLRWCRVLVCVEAVLEFILAARLRPLAVWMASGWHRDLDSCHHDLAKLAVKFQAGARFARRIQPLFSG